VTLGSGAVLGELSFFLGTKRSATVRAACWSVVLHLERKDVDIMLQERARKHEQARLHRMVQEMAHEQAQANAAKATRPSATGAPTTSPQAPVDMTEVMRLTPLQRLRERSRAAFDSRVLPWWRRRIVSMDSVFRRLWDGVMLGLLLYVLFTVPFHIGFLSGPWAQEHAATSWAILDGRYAIDALLLLEMAFSALLFEYSDRGRGIRDPKRIVRNYRSDRLRIDVLANLPYELLALAAPGCSEQKKLLLVCFLRMPKLLNARRLVSCGRTVVRAVPTRFRFAGGAARIARALAILVYANHVAACIWMFIPSWLQPNGPAPHGGVHPSWAATDQACNSWAYETLWVRYLRASYFSITVLSTVGYGDIAPATPLETCFMLMVVVVSTSLFATLIGLISSFIRCRDSEAESLKSQLDYTDHYMHYRNMPRRVRQRIRDFFLLVCSHVGVSQVSAVQAALPSFLLRDLRIQMQHQRVLAVPVLKNVTFFPLKDLCLKLRTTVALMGDMVCEKGCEAGELYFIDFGTIAVYTKAKVNQILRCRRESQRHDMLNAPCRKASGCGRKASGAAGRKSSAGKGLAFGRKGLNSHTEASYLTRDEGGFFGDTMLHYAAQAEPRRHETSCEAFTNCHLFYLSLNAWRALCKLFPEELGSISKVDPRALQRSNSSDNQEAKSGAGMSRMILKKYAGKFLSNLGRGGKGSDDNSTSKSDGEGTPKPINRRRKSCTGGALPSELELATSSADQSRGESSHKARESSCRSCSSERTEDEGCSKGRSRTTPTETDKSNSAHEGSYCKRVTMGVRSWGSGRTS